LRISFLDTRISNLETRRVLETSRGIRRQSHGRAHLLSPHPEELITVDGVESWLLGLLHWILSARVTLTGRCARAVSAARHQAAATHSQYAVSSR